MKYSSNSIVRKQIAKLKKNEQEIWTDNLPKNIQMAKKATKKLLSNIND